MAIDILGQTFYSKVCTKIKRSLIVWRGKCIIHRKQCSVFMGDPCNLLYIRDLKCRISRCFNMDQPRIRTDRCCHIGRI